MSDLQSAGAPTERLATLLPYAGLLLSALLLLAEPAPLLQARNAFFDQLQRWHPRVAGAPRVLVVDIDDESLRRLGQWPWPRHRMAELVERLAADGAAAIGFDMMFAEPDRTSPAAALQPWQVPPELKRQIAALPDHDQRFAAALARAPVVLGFALRDAPGERHPLPQRFGLVIRGELRGAALGEAPGRLASIDAFEQSAPGVGHLSVRESRDGIIRELPLLVSLPEGTAPALALELLRIALGARNYMLEAEGSDGALAAVVVGTQHIATTAAGEARLHYAPFARQAYAPAWAVLEGAAGADFAPSGRIVLIGSSAALLHDLRRTPLGEVVPGVEVHRQLIEQVLEGAALRRPDWVPAAELLALIGGALALIRLTLRQRSARSLMLLAALGSGALALASLGFASHGLLLDPTLPAFGWTLSLGLATLAGLYRAERRQRWVRSVFSRYVSPNLVRHLVSTPDALELGGQRRHCSFVFTDLEGFTPLIERTPPREAVQLINAYLDGMIAIVFRHDGTLLRIVGDALVVMFSAPLEQPDHAARALRCALDMDRFARGFEAGHRVAGEPFSRTRIGVNGGEVTVGNFGGSAMLEYRALGDPINVAARLEAANKVLGTRICVSAAICAEVAGFALRPIGRLQLKGRREPVEAFEPVTAPDPDYARAYRQLRLGEPAALDAFASLAMERPNDPLVRLHLARLQRGERGDLVELR